MKKIAVIFILTAGVMGGANAQSAFSNGFRMGQNAFNSASDNALKEKAQQMEWDRMRRQYGTPALDRLDALDKEAPQLAAELAETLAKVRADKAK